VELARHAVNCRYEDIPEESLQIARMTLLDTLGTLIAGAPSAGCKPIAQRVQDWGGKPESSVLMYGGKVPAHNAALANAVMARALDFCDAMERGLHLGSTVVPAGLAVAEQVGGVRGRDFLAAIAVATDIGARINAATKNYHGFDPTLVCSVFAATVVAGRLMGLDEQEMANALGLALNQSSGTFQSNVDGVLSVRLNQGLAAQAGIVCAQFAQDKLTGVTKVFNGIYGYFQLFARGDAAPEHLLDGLGHKFYVKNTMFKRYPSCGATQSATEAALHLVQRHSFAVDDIDKVRVKVGRFLYDLVGGPFKPGVNAVVNAQFSLQYTVANALLRKDSRLEHFTQGQIEDKHLLSLVRRVEVVLEDRHPDYNRAPVHSSSDVCVLLKNGDQLSHRTDIFTGHCLNPISMDEIVAKFRKNLDYARDWFSPDAGQPLIELVADVASCPDVTRLIPYLTADMGRLHCSEV
jgi:2-methylcitrate dehydratase PrpD